MQDSLKNITEINLAQFGWSEFTTIILVLITGVYAYFTFRMMKASEKAVIKTKESIDAISKQTEALLRPYIDFKLKRYPNHLIYLHIKNTGKTNAENLKFEIDKDFHPFGLRQKESIKNALLFYDEINSFSPGTEITIGLVDIGEIGKIEDISPSKFNITATYCWAGRKDKIVEKTEINLTPFAGSGFIVKPDILQEIHEIKNYLKTIIEKFR